MTDKFLPDKAVDLLDEGAACARMRQLGSRTPEEEQALLRQAAEDTCREMVEVTARYLEECQDIFQREGMEVRPVSEEERARAWEKVCPLVEEYLLSLYGADVYQQVLDALSAAPEQGS